MKFSLTIDMDNAAFEGNARGYLAALLREIGDDDLEMGTGGVDTDTVHDSNGNRVGEWRIE